MTPDGILVAPDGAAREEVEQVRLGWEQAKEKGLTPVIPTGWVWQPFGEDGMYVAQPTYEAPWQVASNALWWMLVGILVGAFLTALTFVAFTGLPA